MSLKLALPLAATLAIAGLAGSAFGDGHVSKEMEAAIKTRQMLMQLKGYNMGILGAMAKGETEYDADLATAAASNLASTSGLNWTILWVEGTAQGEVPGSRSKAEIWSDAAGFEKAFMDMDTAATALVTAAGQDIDALRVALGDAGKACSACHDTYRGPRN